MKQRDKIFSEAGVQIVHIHEKNFNIVSQFKEGLEDLKLGRIKRVA